MIELNKFIPQEVCLNCEICCRFSSLDSQWSPSIGRSELENIIKLNIIPPALLISSNNKGPVRIALTAYKNYFVCPCFDVQNNKCKIYPHRPFECRLYPFLLLKVNKKFYLAYDTKCIYTKNISMLKEYIKYLKIKFNEQKTLNFLKKNIELFSGYPLAEVTIAFQIPF